MNDASILGPAYQKHGFVKLRQVAPPEMLRHFDRLLDENTNQSRPEHFAGYAAEMHDEKVNDFCQSIGRLIAAIVGHRPMLAFCKGFVAVPHLDGHHWHLDTGSYNFIPGETAGYTLWIPTMPIDDSSTGQRGGMSYVSLTDYDGGKEFVAQERLAREVKTYAEFLKRYNELEPTANELEVERVRYSDSFELGDALLFSKNVLHRSNRLTEGVYTQRRAFVVRMVDSEAPFARGTVEAILALATLKLGSADKYLEQQPFAGHLLETVSKNGLVSESPLCRVL